MVFSITVLHLKNKFCPRGLAGQEVENSTVYIACSFSIF